MEDDEDDELEPQEEGEETPSSDGQEQMPPPIPFGQETQASGQGMPPPIPFGQEGGDDMPPPIPFGREAEGALKSGARALAHEALPFAASLAPMAAGAEYGAGLGTMAAPFLGPFAPAGPFVGGLIGGAVAGGIAAYGATKAQEAALDATGLNDTEQRRVNEEENPISTTAGRLLPNVVAFSPGKLTDSIIQRLLMGGGMGAVEAGQELATEGKVSPGGVLEAATLGAVFKDPRKIAQPLMSAGERAGASLLPNYARTSERARAGDTNAADDQREAAASEPVKTARGVAQEQAAPNENVTGVGNNNGERDGGNDGRWAKRRERLMNEPGDEEPSGEGLTTVHDGELPPDVAKAFSDISSDRAEVQKRFNEVFPNGSSAIPAGQPTPQHNMQGGREYPPVNSPRQTPEPRTSTNPNPEQQNPEQASGTNAIINREQPGTLPQQTQNPPPRFPQAQPTPQSDVRARQLAPSMEPGAGAPQEGGLVQRYPGQPSQPQQRLAAPGWDRPAGGAQAILSPELKRVVRVTSDKDVPYLAGPSNDGSTVHFDPRVPDLINVGTPEQPKALNPKQPMLIHEIWEQHVYNRLMGDERFQHLTREQKYQHAHEIATRVEEAALARRGYSPEEIKSYNTQMDALARKTEAERAPDRYPPADLWTKPYPVEEAKALTSEGQRVVGAPNDDLLLEQHRAAREAPGKVQEKMADQQKGELFGPEGTKYDQPTPVTERVPAKQERAAPPPLPEKPAGPRRILEDLTRPAAAEEAPVTAPGKTETPAPARGSSEGAYAVKDRGGTVVAYSKTESLARKRSNSLRIAAETMDQFKPEREFDPRKPEDVQALRDWAQQAVDHAQGEGWTKYMPRQKVEDAAHLKAPREALWMDELKSFLNGKRKPADFIAREKLLRADEEGADLVREQRLEEGDARMRRSKSVETAEADNARAGAGEIDAMARDEGENTVPVYTEKGAVRIPVQKTRKLSEVMAEEQARQTPAYTEIAREIAAQEPNVKVHTVSDADMDRFGKEITGNATEAFYDVGQHTIFLRPNASREAVLHEAVHAITSRRIISNPDMEKLIAAVMKSLGPAVKARFPSHMKNAREFLAYGMTNPAFRDVMAETPVTPAVVNALGLRGYADKITNGFQAFVHAIRRILGLGPDKYTALEAIVNLTDRARKTRDTLPVMREENQIDPMVRQVQQQGDDLLKQTKGIKLLRVRDMDKIAQAADKLFGGAKNNPIRMIHDAIEKARIKALDYVKTDSPMIGDGLTLRKKYEGTDEFRKLETLMNDESYYQRFGDLPVNRQGFRTSGDGAKAYRDSKHADLEQRFNDLPQDLKDYRADLYDYAEARHKQISEATAANRLVKEVGIDDPALAKRFMEGTHSEAEYQRLGADDRERESRLELIQDVLSRSKIEGPYTKFVRRGGFAVTGKFNVRDTGKEVKGSPNTDDASREFKSKADAEEFAKQQHSTAKVQSYYVDKTSGERYSKVTEPVMRDGQPVLDPQGNPRTYEREIAYAKGDPNVEQRWRASVERGYLKLHETYRDALAHEKDIRDSGDFEKTDVQKKKYQPHTDAVTLASNFTNLENKLRSNTLYDSMTPKEKLTVKQLLAEHYLQSLASTRASSSRLHRNYVKGADEDLLRNTYDYAQETGTTLARLEHQPDIDKGLDNAEKAVNQDNINSDARRRVLNEVASRVDDMKNAGFGLASGQMGPLMHRVMSWSYMARLATPGFTIRNVTQPGLFTMPEVGARHGWGATGRALIQAYKDINAGGIMKTGLKNTGKALLGKDTGPVTFIQDMKNRLSEQREKDALDLLASRGSVDADAGFEITEHELRPEGVKLNLMNARKNTALTRGIETGIGALDKSLHYMEEVSRQLPRSAETINRAVSGLTAYRMEYKKLTKDGMPSAEAHENAMRYAGDVVDNTQFKYSDTNKPSWQRNPWARAAFQFKQFGKSTYEFMGRHIGNVISSQDPAERKQSMKALAGIFLTHTMVAGALGLPWEPVRALLIGAKTAGLTNSDWDDFENSVREGFVRLGKDAGFAEKDAKKLGEAMSRGLPRLLGIDLSPGLGIDNMLLFSSPRSGADRDMDNNLSAWMFNMIAGAPAGLQIQMLHGLRDVVNGDYAGGIEKLAPLKMASDVLKAEEGYRHGKVNARGRQTMAPYSGYEATVKALGLPVAREAETNEFQHQVYQKGNEIKDAKAKAIAAWISAKDPEAKTKAYQDAVKAGVAPKDLFQAGVRERSTQQRSVNGAVTNKDTRPIARRLQGVYDTEK